MASYCNNAHSIAGCLAYGQRILAHVTDRPRMEASLLLMHSLDKPRTYLIAHPEAILTDSQYRRFSAALEQRCQHVPLPYITGHIEFYGLDFVVTPDVLIPRPETELLVEHTLTWAQQHSTHPLRIADVCTGSGCIAVSIAKHLPGVEMWASDLSLQALKVARINAQHHRQTMHFVQGDLLSPLSGTFDVIISNPPYVTLGEWQLLPASVKQEPRMALISGEDGLDDIRRLLVQARERLAPQGCLLIEFGETQGTAILALAKTTFPKSSVEILRDLAGKDRVLSVQLA